MTDDAPSKQSSTEDDRYERFMRLIVEHEPAARSYLRGLLPSWTDVDEVIQEASLVAWRKFDEFTDGTSFGGWLLTIARFEALRYRRRIARSPLVFTPDVWELLEQDAGHEELAPSRLEHLEACMEKMDAQQRKLLLRAHAPGVTIRELAKQAERSEQAFYKSLQRWRRKLLDCVTRAIALEEK